MIPVGLIDARVTRATRSLYRVMPRFDVEAMIDGVHESRKIRRRYEKCMMGEWSGQPAGGSGATTLPSSVRRPASLVNAMHWWKLNESALPCANSGSRSLAVSNQGTFTTVPGIVYGNQGIFGPCLEVFPPGSIDTERTCVYTPTPVAGDLPAGAFTISAWVYPHSQSGSQALFGKMIDPTLANYNNLVGSGPDYGAWSFIFYMSSGNPTWGIKKPSFGTQAMQVSTQVKLVPNAWQLITGYWDGVNTIGFFLNGSRTMASSNGTNPRNIGAFSIDWGTGAGGPFAIGGPASPNSLANNFLFAGMISDVIVENGVTTEATIRARYYQGIGWGA